MQSKEDTPRGVSVGTINGEGWIRKKDFQKYVRDLLDNERRVLLREIREKLPKEELVTTDLTDYTVAQVVRESMVFNDGYNKALTEVEAVLSDMEKE